VSPRVEVSLRADKPIITGLVFCIPLVMQLFPTMLIPSLMIIVEPKKGQQENKPNVLIQI
jgi:hypothetical protein